ncbi:MAG: hypothetical protein LBE83_03360 [Propionibacteriaceae bacterium]|nr:hypothetical protein [Propionibacteriaceae bacterium]
MIACSAAALFLLSSPFAQAVSPVSTDGYPTAGWLARTLAAHDDLALTPAGEIDYASTAYAILGLRATGVASGQITASTTALIKAGEAFIGTSDQIADKTTAIALMILAMKAADLDPATYSVDADGSTRDLYADLNSAMNEDGSISSWPSAYGQSFALLALATAPDGAPQVSVDWLEAQPCVDPESPGYGGYGFAGPGSCDDADPDSTALAILALAALGRTADQLSPSRTFLWSTMDENGGFVSPFSGANANTTGLALAALKANYQSDESSKILAGEIYLTRLTYGCDLADTDTRTRLAGAIAYDGATRERIGSWTEEYEATLTQSSAQALWGLVDHFTVTNARPANSEVPKACYDIEGIEPSSGAIWWWVGGGIVILAGIFLIRWRILAVRRARR